MNIINRIFKLEEIDGDGVCPTYLYRWTLLSTRWFKAYLHRFVGPDWTKDLHDHPKRFVTIGLWGQYRETTPEGERIWRAPWMRSFSAEHQHRIEMVNGGQCWTIAIVFKTVRQWGFWHNGRWIYWRKYVDDRELTARMKSCAD